MHSVINAFIKSNIKWSFIKINCADSFIELNRFTGWMDSKQQRKSIWTVIIKAPQTDTHIMPPMSTNIYNYIRKFPKIESTRLSGAFNIYHMSTQTSHTSYWILNIAPESFFGHINAANFTTYAFYIENDNYPLANSITCM